MRDMKENQVINIEERSFSATGVHVLFVKGSVCMPTAEGVGGKEKLYDED